MKLSEFAKNCYFPYAEKYVRLNTYLGYESSYRLYIEPTF